MKFDIPKKEHPNLERYYKEDIDTSYKFANEIYKELGSFIRAVVIFGSTARRTKGSGGDIDVLVVERDLDPVALRHRLAVVGVALYVVAGGVSQWERACLGLPTLILVLAPNQAPSALALADMGAALTLDVGDPGFDSEFVASFSALARDAALF